MELLALLGLIIPITIAFLIFRPTSKTEMDDVKPSQETGALKESNGLLEGMEEQTREEEEYFLNPIYEDSAGNVSNDD